MYFCKNPIQWLVVTFILVGFVNIAAVSAQADGWESVRDQIFHLAEVIVHNAQQESVSDAEMRRINFELKQLDARFYEASKLCPSAKECASLREILEKCSQLTESLATGSVTQEEKKSLAMLRQAVHSYRLSRQSQPTQPATSPAPPAQKTPVPARKTPKPNSRQESAAPPKKAASSAPKPQQQPASSEVTLLYIYRALGQGKFLRLTDKGSMQSGDHYKIFFEVPKSSYVYIFQTDTSGKIFGLFPLTEFRGEKLQNLSNPVKPKTQYFIPAKDKSFVLDRQTGLEHFYFLMLPERDPELEEQYEMFVNAQNADKPKELQVAQSTFMKSLLQKGPLHIAPDQLGQTAPAKESSQPAPTATQSTREDNTISWQEAGENFSVLRQRLTGDCEECVHSLSFQHK